MNMLKTKIILFLWLLSFALLPNLSTTKASSSATLYIDPLNIIDPNVTPGTQLSFLIKVDNVTDLYAWQIKLYYDPEFLNWTGADYPPGHIFQGKSTAPVTPVNASDPEGVYVLYFLSLTGAQSGFTGSGILCRVNFTVIARGVSHLHFSRPLGEDT
ncbi:MAG: cohesin domain-containing protein, partial [Candidatus Bathyarchaeia archaeon]